MNVKVSCPSCGRVTELDAAKIPPKPVTFGCPGCKTKVPIDGSKIHEAEPVAAAAVTPPVDPAPPEPPAPSPESASPEPAPAPQPAPSMDEEFDLLEHLEIPEDAVLPSGLLISDDPVISRYFQRRSEHEQSPTESEFEA